MEKKNILKRYNLPKEVVYCKKCTISNQRPRISFDTNGICSACNFSKFKNNINISRSLRFVLLIFKKYYNVIILID